MRKNVIFASLFCSLALFFLCKTAAGEMPITPELFLSRLEKAYERVPAGFGRSRISRTLIGDGLSVLTYSDSLFLTVKSGKEEHLESVAVVFVTNEPEPSARYMKGGAPDESTLFASICSQVAIALEPQLPDDGVKRIMEAVGVGGAFIDGRRRSVRDGSYEYIMRLHPNGMAIMVASRVESGDLTGEKFSKSSKTEKETRTVK